MINPVLRVRDPFDNPKQTGLICCSLLFGITAITMGLECLTQTDTSIDVTATSIIASLGLVFLAIACFIKD